MDYLDEAEEHLRQEVVYPGKGHLRDATSYLLRYLRAGPRTTEPVTKDNLSAVDKWWQGMDYWDKVAAKIGFEQVMASTIQETQASSPLDPKDTESGPVEPVFWCAHTLGVSPVTCPTCGAKLSYDRILVPVVAPTPSTSPKPVLKPSVLDLILAMLQLKKLSS